jgi:hypothetical protein
LRALGPVVALVVVLAGCGYDTNNQNSPNSKHIGSPTATPGAP